ncbi:MAG: histidine phosphatase family protein [Anaerolineaceae bacterium]|nr:histidine phosphatase family protein [Anaerolineaceae bacterium]
MHFYFIRHAQSFNNALWDRTGNSIGRSDDPELTGLGVEQARILAKQIGQAQGKSNSLTLEGWKKNDLQFTHIYSSLMMRAVQTGQEVAKSAGLKLAAWHQIHEGGGIFCEDPKTGVRTGQPGKPRRFFEETFPDLALPPGLDGQGWWNRPHETQEECELRAGVVLDELMKRHGNSQDRVAIISHGGFYNVLMRNLLGIPYETKAWLVMNNCGITRIDFEEDEARVVYTNRLDFMPKRLIS